MNDFFTHRNEHYERDPVNDLVNTDFDLVNSSDILIGKVLSRIGSDKVGHRKIN